MLDCPIPVQQLLVSKDCKHIIAYGQQGKNVLALEIRINVFLGKRNDYGVDVCAYQSKVDC